MKMHLNVSDQRAKHVELIFHESAFDHLFTDRMEPRRAKTWLMWGCSGIDHLGSWPGQDNPPIPSQARMHLTWPQEFSSTSYFSCNPFLTFLGGSKLWQLFGAINSTNKPLKPECSFQDPTCHLGFHLLEHIYFAWCFKELLYFCAVPLITSWAVQDRSLPPRPCQKTISPHLCRPPKHDQEFAS